MWPWDRWDKGSEAKWLRAHLDGIGYEITRTLGDAFEVRTPWTLHEQLEPLVSVWATGADTPQPPLPDEHMLEYETVEVDGIPVHHDHTHITWLSASGNARVWVETPFRYDRRNLKPLDGVSQRELAFIGPLIRATAGSDPDPLPPCRIAQEPPGQCALRWELQRLSRDVWLREHLNRLGYEITETLPVSFEVRQPGPSHPDHVEGPIR